jgi:hypothetical protein
LFKADFVDQYRGGRDERIDRLLAARLARCAAAQYDLALTM